MTARTLLDRRMRWFAGGMYAGTGLFLGGMLIGVAIGGEPIWSISLPGFAVGLVAAMAAHFGGLRCSQCRGNLGAVLMGQGWRLSVDSRVCFCPYCGVRLDEELASGACGAASGQVRSY